VGRKYFSERGKNIVSIQVMNCLTEFEIEQLVRNCNVNAAWHTHLQQCDFCRDRFHWLTSYYQGVQKEYESCPTPAIKTILGTQDVAAKSGTYIAYPFISKRVPPLPPKNLPILRADSDTNEPFENIGVLVTENQEVLVRVMRNTETKEVILHLIAGSADKYRNVLVRIPSLEGEYTSDEYGRVPLGRVILPSREELFVEVETPRATFELASLDLPQDQVVAQTEVVLTNEQNDSIRVEFIPTDLRYTLKVHLLTLRQEEEKNHLRVLVVRRSNGQRWMKAVKKGVAVFQGLQQNGELRIQVFD